MKKVQITHLIIIVIAVTLITAFAFGPQELRDKMGAATLLAGVTAIAGFLRTKLFGKNTNEQLQRELDISDDKWSNLREYGFTSKKAITVKNIDEYMSQITTSNGAKVSWEKGPSEIVRCENYNYSDTKVTRAIVRVNGEVKQPLFFIEGCKNNSINLPKGYVSKEEKQ